MILYNDLNLKSLALHFGMLNDIIDGVQPFPEQFPRIDGQVTPLGEVRQVFRWTEDIDIDRLR